MLRLGPQNGAQALLSGGRRRRRSTGGSSLPSLVYTFSRSLSSRKCPTQGSQKKPEAQKPKAKKPLQRSTGCSFYSSGGRSLPLKPYTLPEMPAGILKSPPLAPDKSPDAGGCTSAG